VPVADRDKVLVDLKDGRGLTTNDFCCGILVTGATGGGKSTGPGQLLAQALLRARLNTGTSLTPVGGIVLCAKSDECAQWQEWANRNGRLADVRVVRPGGKYKLNFLDYEASRGSEGAGQIINTVSLLYELAHAAARAGGALAGAQGGDAKFFNDALHLFLTALVAVVVVGRRKLTLGLMRELAASAARSQEEMKSRAWHESSVLAQLLAQLCEEAPSMDATRRADFRECLTYWTSDYVNLSERTRGIIDMMFAMTVTPFLYSPLRELFTEETTLTPDETAQGKIIIIDLPVQDFRLAGKISALVWQHLFQIFVMRRSGPNLPCCFLWCDEFQNFVTERSALFQAVARGCGGASVMLTQQRESVTNEIGEGATENLFANLQTKFFCQNTGATNEWASDLISSRYVQILSTSIGRGARPDADHPSPDRPGGGGEHAHANVSRSEQLRAFIQPSRFQSLRRGGSENDFVVEAVCFQGGRMFRAENGLDDMLPFKILKFRQR
jgi:hypothetical protein